MAVVLYGKDFLGRSVAKAYGNFHLPASEGSHLRKVKIFEAIPPSNAATCCACLMGYINELKNPEKVLLGVEAGREYLKTKPIGEITARVEVRRYNFDKYGYE